MTLNGLILLYILFFGAISFWYYLLEIRTLTQLGLVFPLNNKIFTNTHDTCKLTQTTLAYTKKAATLIRSSCFFILAMT